MGTKREGRRVKGEGGRVKGGGGDGVFTTKHTEYTKEVRGVEIRRMTEWNWGVTGRARGFNF